MTNYDGVCAKIKRPVIKGQLFKPDGMLNFPFVAFLEWRKRSLVRKRGMYSRAEGNVGQRVCVSMTQWWCLAVQICPCSAVREQLVA